MNIFEKIKTAWMVKHLAETEFKEATMPDTSGKPGWKTTEFWGKLGLQVMTLWGAVSGFVPPKYALIVGASLEAIYGVCRTVGKAVSDIQAARVAAPATETANASVTIAK